MSKIENTPPISARLYISGQISGLQRSQYMERFSEAERLLREIGYVNIVNPTRIWACKYPRFHRFLVRVLGEQRAYPLILLYDLWLLMRCQRIYKIPGWKTSHGAQIESAVAYNMGLFLVSKTDRTVVDRRLEKIVMRQEGSAGNDSSEDSKKQKKE